MNFLQYILFCLIWKKPNDVCRFCDADLYNGMPCKRGCIGRVVNS